MKLDGDETVLIPAPASSFTQRRYTLKRFVVSSEIFSFFITLRGESITPLSLHRKLLSWVVP